MNPIEKIYTIIETQKIRYFRFQKFVFLSEIKNVLDQEGIEAYLLTDTFRNQKYHSLIVGNLKQSKKLIISHYDTPSLIHNMISFKPFDTQKRQKISMIIDGAKTLLIVLLVSYPLFILTQNILNGNNVLFYGVLSLILFLFSVLLIRLPFLILSYKNENGDTLKYLFKQVFDKNDDTSFVIVDDGMSFQMGYQIIGKNLSQINYKHEIHLLDQMKSTKQALEIDSEKTILKFFEGLKVKLFTS